MKQTLVFSFFFLTVIAGSKLLAQNNPVTAIALDKMNVLYAGINNPMTIAVSGLSADKITAVMTGGTVTGNNGKYVARPDKTGIATIDILYGSKKISSTEFRVKAVPEPRASVAGKTGDNVITREELMSITGVSAILPDFQFDLNFTVTSFDLSLNVKGTPVTESSANNKITSNQANYLKMVNSGTKVYFENVKAKGQDGQISAIPGVNLKVK